jgi:hypothetical protein
MHEGVPDLIQSFIALLLQFSQLLRNLHHLHNFRLHTKYEERVLEQSACSQSFMQKMGKHLAFRF